MKYTLQEIPRRTRVEYEVDGLNINKDASYKTPHVNEACLPMSIFGIVET